MHLSGPSRKLLVLAGLVACGFSFATAGPLPHRSHHPPKKMEREQIEALEQQWSKSMLSGDVNSMDKLLSDDFLGVTAGGDLVTKEQQLDRMRNRQLTVTRLDTIESKIKLIGQIAIVTSLAQVDTLTNGKAVSGAFRYTRVYQHLANGSWKITSFEATRVRPGDRLSQHAPGDSAQ